MQTLNRAKSLLSWRALCVTGVLLAAVACRQPAAADPDRFSGLVVFGDSLSDNGNVGRFSNGPVWVEVLASRIGTELTPSRLGGTNFAVGGARSHGRPVDIRGQFHAFITGPHGPPAADALFIVSGGANDLLAAGCNGGETAARTGASAIAATVADLAAAGARHILVPNLPDLSASPIVQVQGSACIQHARQMTLAFNAALEQALRRVERRTDIRVIRLDAFELSEELIANPGKAGFTNINTPCLQGPCEGALFWDQLHPTARAHARLAKAALQALGIPGGD